MGIGDRNPWPGGGEFRQQLERLFDEAQARSRAVLRGYVWAPLADLVETPTAIIALVELPGVRQEDLVVEISDGDLLVRGERPFDREDPDAAYLLLERAHGTFARRFPLPPGVDSESITARLSEGVLTITVPKRAASIDPRSSIDVG